jgi:CheY-like chemotaxis protein
MPTLSAQAITRKSLKTSILVVEDNSDHQLLLRYVLQRSFADTTPIFADTAEQALNYLSQCQQQQIAPPNLVLLDLYLPNVEQGWQFLQQIKTFPPAQRPPVVVLSVSREEEDVLKAYQLGATSYITKPIGREEWLTYFQRLRQYWWDTVTLPGNNSLFQS